MLAKFLNSRLAVYLLAILTVPLTPTAAETVNLEPIKDNTIFSENGNLSNALGDLFVGRTNNAALRRALIAFDIVNSGIPAGAQITSVTLTLEAAPSNPSSNIISLHKVTQDWGEGTSFFNGGQGASATTNDVTWTNRFFNTTNAWTVEGGDFSSTNSGLQTVANSGSNIWNSTPQMVADVQDWLDDPSNNFGWLLMGGESTNQTAKRFTSREGTGNRPILTIDFTPAQTGCQDVFCGEDIPGFPGWRASPWYLNYNVEFLPWIFHDEHGWQFLFPGSTEEVIFLWDLGLGEWIFLNESSYRWIFLFGGENAGWVFTFDDNTPERRFFQRLDNGALFSVPPGLPPG